MARFLSFSLAAFLAAGVAQAQTQPAPQQPVQKPRPGTILDTPSTGRITESPTATPTTSTGAPKAGETIERFEATGNTTVASDTIRVYLGITPGDPYNPDALQRNFLNLWQTGLFDDIKLEADRGDKGVVIRAIVKERPRIGSVEYR